MRERGTAAATSCEVTVQSRPLMAESSDTPKSAPDPESYRMTVGEHLEELRRRLLFGLVGLVIAGALCMLVGERLMVIFCRPLYRGLLSHGINPQLYTNGLPDAFMTYLKVSLIAAAMLAGPWIIFQLWLFVAAGLYPHERRTITRYIPLSIGLFAGGVVFVYFLVLPLTVTFLLDFGSAVPAPRAAGPTTQVAAEQVMQLPILNGDPSNPVEGQVWLNEYEGQVKLYRVGKMRALVFGSDNLLSPMYTLPEYIDLVLTTMLTFGLCFQLPIVVMALAKVGIVDVPTLRRSRRVVYFVMSILAAVIAPGDLVTIMMALLVPMILLYELGILMAKRSVPAAVDGGETSNV